MLIKLTSHFTISQCSFFSFFDEYENVVDFRLQEVIRYYYESGSVDHRVFVNLFSTASQIHSHFKGFLQFIGCIILFLSFFPESSQ